MCGLIAESTFVKRISQNAEGKDRYGQNIAAVVSVAASELGEGFVAVFVSSGEIPECWVEDDATGSNCSNVVSKSSGWEGEVFSYSISSA